MAETNRIYLKFHFIMDYAGNIRYRWQNLHNVGDVYNFWYHFDDGYLAVMPAQTSPTVYHYIPSYHYQVRDHQGNIRVVVDEVGNLEQKNEYFAYGGPWGSTSTNQGFQPYKYNGKELDRIHGLDWYDYGARRYDPAYCMFTQMDPLCEKYPHLSPYVYCAGNPVNYVDPDGQRIFMLFYTEGNRRGDAMFKAAAETRRDDIINRSDFDSNTDLVILQSIQDLGQLEGIINGIIDDYSENYGQTAEFSIWSHAGLDGPTGTIKTSHDAIDGYQMSINGWSSINFNWDQNAMAGFFGCKTGVGNNDSPSFVTRLSAASNFRDVIVYGQTSSAYPSANKHNRTVNRDILHGRFKGNIYMVGGNRLDFKSRFFPSPINPWKRSINGKGYYTRQTPY